MPCLGVHFSLTDTEADHLRSLGDEQQRLEYVIEVLEGLYFDDRLVELARTGTAWDALHRVLSGGDLTWAGGDYPLNHVILGGELLFTDPDSFLSLKDPDQVRAIAAALPAITEDEFRRRYFALDPDSYGSPLTEDDLAFTWLRFQDVRNFYMKAAAEGRHVLFTADQ
jgi:hypothetical protein